jgi:hypothetical protein
LRAAAYFCEDSTSGRITDAEARTIGSVRDAYQAGTNDAAITTVNTTMEAAANETLATSHESVPSGRLHPIGPVTSIDTTGTEFLGSTGIADDRAAIFW